MRSPSVAAAANDAIGVAEVFGARNARGGTVRAEGNGDCGTYEIHDAGAWGSDGKIEEELAGIIGGREDDVGIEIGDLPREVGAHLRVAGKGANIDTV